MRFLRLTLLSVCWLVLGTTSARAGIVNLTYQGVNGDNSYIRAVGSGSFQFASTSASIGLADLTSFSFAQTTTLSDPSLSGSSSYSYSLANLVSFSATFSASGAITALSFRTNYGPASNGFLNPQYFVLSSLNRNGATSYQSGPDGDVTTGTVIAATAVPEPSSLTLGVVAGLIGCAAGWRRRGLLAR